MYPIVDAYEQHCFEFKHVYVVGETGVGMVLEGVTWEMHKDLNVGVGCVD